eukprot:1150049-Pelagomonas_calceolata.AAC.10
MMGLAVADPSWTPSACSIPPGEVASMNSLLLEGFLAPFQSSHELHAHQLRLRFDTAHSSCVSSILAELYDLRCKHKGPHKPRSFESIFITALSSATPLLLKRTHA